MLECLKYDQTKANWLKYDIFYWKHDQKALIISNSVYNYKILNRHKVFKYKHKLKLLLFLIYNK